MDLILSHISKKLIVIAAPAGYGKTMLLADFAAHGGLPVCWVQLQERATDLVYLGGLLRASLNRRYRRLRGNPRDLELSALTPEGMARVFAGLIEEEISDPFVIVIDEIQVANRSKELLQFLDTLLEVLPAQVTTVVAGREPPEISLAKLMANGELAGIGPQDLALRREELLELIQASLPSDALPAFADQLLEDTRGWITGVLLSRELSKGSGTLLELQGRPMVYEYLASVVLNRVGEDLRRFMRESSVLRVMTSSSCDQVLHIDDSARHLSKIARQGLFVTESEGSPRTYEYHPLFRGFLLVELEASDPRLLMDLRLRAARYQELKGLPEEAVNLYLEAGNRRDAKRVAERLARDMVRRGRIKTLAEWSESLRALGAPSMHVLRLLAISYVDRGRLDSAEELLGEIESLVGERTPHTLRGAIENLRGLILYRRGKYDDVLRTASVAERLLRHRRPDHLHLGMTKRLMALASAAGGADLRRSEELGAEAVAHLERAGEQYSLASGLIDLFGYQQLLGKTLEAWRTITRAHRILEALESPLPLASCTVNLGLLLAQRGRYEEALGRFDEAVRLARRAGSSLFEAQAVISQADLFSELGMFHQAAQLYERALELASTIGDLEVLGFGCLRASILHRRAGNPDLAAGWLARAIDLGGPHRRLAVAIEIQQAALTVHEHPRTAIERLGHVLEGHLGQPNAFDLATSRLWLGYAWSLAGDTTKADQFLGAALATARTTDCDQSIVGELNCHPELMRFFTTSLVVRKDLQRISDRLELMRSLARQYQEPQSAGSQPGRLEVRALGRGSTRYEGASLRNLKPLHRDILFYIVDKQRADRDQLLEEFWPEQAPGRQAANLHMAIYSLRRVLGKESILHDGRYYSMGEGLSLEYDVAKFERAAGAALRLAPGDPRRYFALTEAISSYSGRFLEHSDQPWANTRRRHLDDLFVQLTELYAEEAMQRGNAIAAISMLARALEIDPLRDSVNARYFEVLGSLGRRSELVAGYARYVRLLAEDLGLDPPPQVSALYSRLIG